MLDVKSWRGQDALVHTPSVLKQMRLLFPSGALIQDTRFSPHSSPPHLTRTSCLTFLSEAVQCVPDWEVKYLLSPDLKTDRTTKKVCLWQLDWRWSNLWVEVCLTLFPFRQNAPLKSQVPRLTAFQKPSDHRFLLFFYLSPFPPYPHFRAVPPPTSPPPHLSSASPLLLFSHFLVTAFKAEVKEVISDGEKKKKKEAQAAWTRPGVTLLFHNLCLLVLFIKSGFYALCRNCIVFSRGSEAAVPRQKNTLLCLKGLKKQNFSACQLTPEKWKVLLEPFYCLKMLNARNLP